MRIRTKLQLNAIASIVLAFFIGAVLFNSNRQFTQARDKVARANKIVSATTEMRFVTFEYLLNHNERSLEQWNNKYLDITNLLMPEAGQSQSERKILDEILSEHQDIHKIFEKLVADYENLPTDQNLLDKQNAQDKQLISQLLIKQQIKVSDAYKLAAMGQDEISSAIRTSNLMIILAIIILIILVAANTAYTTFGITRALASLQRGAQAIASGKLTYRIQVSRDDEFGRVATLFNNMAASLQELDRAKSEFILLASHQLRTPLTAVRWSIEELVYPKKKLSKSKQTLYLNQIHESTERMIKLVSALLSVAKIDLGLGTMPAKPESVQLAEVVDEVLKDLSAQTLKKHIQITTQIADDLPTVFIDRTWARSIIQNLLSNAVKYSSDSETVNLTISQQQTEILLTIQDHGMGIPASQKDKIFTKLFRADNAQKHESDGSGLGLYIAKAMVEDSGGSIWFESVENKGSTFYVKLPTGQSSLSV